MTTATNDGLDELVARAREAARAAGELPEPDPTAAPIQLPENVALGGWLSQMVRSGEWATMMGKITAEDPEVSDDPVPI